jgi:glycosyltransferase 2 family protein
MLKKGLRIAVISLLIAFLGRAVMTHWQEVAQVRISSTGWGWIGVAMALTLLAHTWAGCVWAIILRLCQPPDQPPVPLLWGAQVYLKTNIAKYLPGNVWHFYGRVNACREKGMPIGPSILSILLEPLLMLAAALILAFGLGLWGGLGGLNIGAARSALQPVGLVIVLATVLAGIHPRILNRLLARIGKLKKKALGASGETLAIGRYPLGPLLGELGFLLLRATGFVAVWVAILPIGEGPQSVSTGASAVIGPGAFPDFVAQLPQIYSSFSLAWLVGLVMPGLPGGVGVFEAVMLGLQPQQPPNPAQHLAALVSILALYRLVNTLAEAVGAGLAVLWTRTR